MVHISRCGLDIECPVLGWDEYKVNMSDLTGFSFNGEFFREHEPLLNFKNVDDASIYFESIFGTCTPKEKQDMICAYFGINRRHLHKISRPLKNKLRGGGGGDSTQCLFNVLAAADSYHDFKGVASGVVKELVSSGSIKEINMTTLKNENELLMKLQGPEKLTTSNGIEFPNPFLNAKITEKKDISTAKNMDQLFAQQEKANIATDSNLPIDRPRGKKVRTRR